MSNFISTAMGWQEIKKGGVPVIDSSLYAGSYWENWGGSVVYTETPDHDFIRFKKNGMCVMRGSWYARHVLEGSIKYEPKLKIILRLLDFIENKPEDENKLRAIPFRGGWSYPKTLASWLGEVVSEKYYLHERSYEAMQDRLMVIKRYPDGSLGRVGGHALLGNICSSTDTMLYVYPSCEKEIKDAHWSLIKAHHTSLRLEAKKGD